MKFIVVFVRLACLIAFLPANAEILEEANEIKIDEKENLTGIDVRDVEKNNDDNNLISPRINLCSICLCKVYCLQRGYRVSECKSRRSTKNFCRKSLF